MVSCLGSFVQPCCRQGGGAADKCSLACVGSTRSIPATLGFPPLAACVLSLSTMLRLQAALQGACPELCVVPVFGYSKRADSVGPAFCAFPSLSSSGSQELDGRTLPGCSEPYPLCSPSLSFHAHQLGALCVCSRELASSCDPPGGCQLSRISGSLWLETGSLFAVW